MRWRARSRVRVACALALASFAQVVPSRHREPYFRHRRTDGSTLAVRDFLLERGRMGATATLAGRRRRTDFKDVPNQIETFTIKTLAP